MVRTIETLKAERLRLGLTQWQLGLMLGIRQPHVANVERLWSRPGEMLLGLWCQALGVNVDRTFDWRANFEAYLAHKAAMGMDAPARVRWPVDKVRQAVRVIRDLNCRLLDEFAEMGGTPEQETEILNEINDMTEMRVTVICESSGWLRAEIDEVNDAIHAEDAPEPVAVVTPVAAVEPAPVPVAPVFKYVPHRKPVAPPVPVVARKPRAVVLSNETEARFEREYAPHLRAVLDIVGVKVPDRRIQGQLDGVDVVVVCISRISHSDFYAARAWAASAGVQVIALPKSRSRWHEVHPVFARAA